MYFKPKAEHDWELYRFINTNASLRVFATEDNDGYLLTRFTYNEYVHETSMWVNTFTVFRLCNKLKNLIVDKSSNAFTLWQDLEDVIVKYERHRKISLVV